MPIHKKPSYSLALVEAILVNVVCASSFIFVKLALKELGPLTIGGLRYFIGFLILLPFMLRKGGRFSTSPRIWLQLLFIGLSAYTIGNGAMFWSLKFLPATTVSFMMGMITLLILFGGILWLREIPNRVQSAGILVTLAGTAMFFSIGLKPGEPLGMAILAIGLISFTIFGVLGRDAARGQKVDTLALTAIPLALGGGLLLLVALPLEGLPHASPVTWGMVLWLAVVNTALGYILYNHSLQVLTAFEMNVMLNLSPVLTAIMGWFLLNERLTVLQWIGMVVVIVGVALVQRPRRRPT
ncbi:MAG: EamA family transporter, partial [Anaerolineales bacterium]|nr:EamA family transporter [Anaerolineales bacterium]